MMGNTSPTMPADDKPVHLQVIESDNVIAITNLEPDSTDMNGCSDTRSVNSESPTSAAPPTQSSDCCLLSKVEQQIIAIIESEEEKKILMSLLPESFESRHSTRLPCKELGFKKMKAMIAEIQSLWIIPSAQPGQEYIGLVGNAVGISPHLPDGITSSRATRSKMDGTTLLDGIKTPEKVPASAPEEAPDSLRDAFLVCEEQIALLIDESEELKVTVEDLPSIFQTKYSKEIPVQELGHRDLMDLLLKMKLITVCGKPSGTELYVRRSLKNGCEASDCLNYLLIAANNLRGRLYKRIIRFLEANPDGVRCGDIVKEVKGFVHYLKQCSDDSGKESISPAAVLRNLEGVKVKIIDGKPLFFLESSFLEHAEPTKEVSSTDNYLADDISPVLEPSIRNTTGGDHSHDETKPLRRPSIGNTSNDTSTSTVDGLAAENFICLLEKEFHDRPWPGFKKQLNQYLFILEKKAISEKKADAVKLISWIERRFSEETTVEKRRKAALNYLMDHLKRSGCLQGTNNKLEWDMNYANEIAERNKNTTKRNKSVSSDIRKIQKHGTNTTENGLNLIETAEQLNIVRQLAPFATQEETRSKEQQIVAIDCEGVPENLYLIQVGTSTATYVFDCVKLGAREVCAALSTLLMDSDVTKLFHDLHKDAVAIAHIGEVQPIRGTLDTQLAVESLTGELHIGFNRMLEHFERDNHPLKPRFKRKMDDKDLFARRPLPPDVLEYAALDVSLLLDAKDSLFTALGNMRDSVQCASDARAKAAPTTGGARNICFDVANSYSLASLELLTEQRPADMLVTAPLQVSDDTEVLLKMLPEDLREVLDGKTQELSDIVLDKGRVPLAWVGDSRLLLGNAQRMVDAEDIASIVEKLGGFGSDNRAGLEKQLHRVSAIRNRQSDIIGLTMRVGRHVEGNAAMISDMLFNDCTKSILFLGEPGSGKTTVVREATRLLAERFNVCIVDTSNEIAGDGDVPHPCVGLARRMMVPSLDKQSAVMIECVQNHTPEVMIIDEIGRPTEVEAARTCKQRGVRLIASAHGDLRKLVRNPKLRGLVGGVETVTLGDAQAKAESMKAGNSSGIQKLKAQRAGSPVFDVIVELRRGAYHEWRIVLDTADSVDRILEGQQYLTQRRTRDPSCGLLSLELESA